LGIGQLGGTDLHCPGEVALGEYRVTGADAVIALGRMAAHRIIRRAMLLWGR
jgi:hypothetical protein